MSVWKKLLPFAFYGNAIVLVFLALYYFLAPAVLLVNYLRDPGLSTGKIPGFAYAWHRQLSRKFEPWARERVNSGTAQKLDQQNISGTEWPMFGSVYYLWATESLQAEWESDPTLATTAPKEASREAVEAAAELVADPNHAAWVKKYWGENYLDTENIFYRMLYISGLTSYQKISGDHRYQAQLLHQVDSLAQELDASPYGLLDDYPGQCYPIDILPAIAAIQRADQVLGTNHAAFLQRAVRGFEATRLDSQTELPAYIADPRTGRGIGPSRGVGISYMLIWAPELWPETVKTWYPRYERYFWQQDRFLAGFREFARGSNYSNWFFADIDAGPVLNGYGVAASAFGLGAARVNGRMDQAYPLAAEALVAAWPLPDGSLLTPRFLSNLSDAPYLGEAALLFALTRTPLVGKVSPAPESLPWVVYFSFAVYLGLFVFTLVAVWQVVGKGSRCPLAEDRFPLPNLQLGAWAFLLVAGLAGMFLGQGLLGFYLLILAQFLPRARRGYFHGLRSLAVHAGERSQKGAGDYCDD